MRLLKRFGLFLAAFFLLFNLSAQSDSCALRISLLTCGPGEDLYSIFGHSALRVSDPSSGSDVIYNYGTFDFEDPDFYVKFVRGKLLYFVSVEQFNRFMYAYQLENRWVIEQELKLTCTEKSRLAEALRVNALEENKYYLYEFLFDNCSTRLRDIVKNNADDSVRFKSITPYPPPTFRNMLHDYLNASGHHWSKFGIDLLLGSRIDRKVLNEEAMFLPDYLMKGFDSSLIRNTSLVQSKRKILDTIEVEKSSSIITPLVVTSFLLVCGILLFVFRSGKFSFAAVVLDRFLFLSLGIMGCVMLFMWYGTDHELCRNNYNLYWALPTHLIAAFFVGRNTALVRKYFSVSAILSSVFVLSWPFLPQGMNAAFFPLILLSAIRSLHIALNRK